MAFKRKRVAFRTVVVLVLRLRCPPRQLIPRAPPTGVQRDTRIDAISLQFLEILAASAKLPEPLYFYAHSRRKEESTKRKFASEEEKRRKLQRAGRPAFNFHGFLRSGIVHDGNLVAVLKAALIDHLLHLFGS